MAAPTASPVPPLLSQPSDHNHLRPPDSSGLSSSTNLSDSTPGHDISSDAPTASNLTGRPRPSLLRSQSAINSREARRLSQQDGTSSPSRNASYANLPSDPESDWQMRHGWDQSAEKLRELSTTFFMYYDQKRHYTGGNPSQDPLAISSEEWRMRDRLKTVSAALALCLNLGVDPPDVIKTNPCARLECWYDPSQSSAIPGSSPIAEIGKHLQAQYEVISMRTRYKLLADPTVDEMKKYCCTLRRTAKDERILFHYNGHGVPKPTPSGEIWVFNKGYTQYIPISLYDLQSWLGAPTLLVYDCSDSGLIIQNYKKFLEKHEEDNQKILRQDPSAHVQSFSDCIHLGATMDGEALPINPLLPADLFTSCLTTPIEISVRIFIIQNPLDKSLDDSVFKLIPGKSSERRTPIGELNWIFTAITDTIAWNSLPKPLFKKLFRQDLMVAALFRNFLLAQRIMRRYGCHPQCHPPIPSCHEHPLWDSWDLAIELVLAQLPNFVYASNNKIAYEYHHSDFFAEQLTAFEVYLDQGAVEEKEPEQLPIVLQVLLSQVHRLRALVLLSKFLDRGPWAVKLALGIGIFPYVLKLLQSQATELKPVMVFIWARILAVDQSCQSDLLKDNGYMYFGTLLNPVSGLPVKIVGEHRMMCAFIIAMFCKDYRQGQSVAASVDIIEYCLQQASFPETEHPGLRQWSSLCLSMLWKDFPDAKWIGIRTSAHVRLCKSTLDPVPEVRAAILHALTNFIGIPEMTDQIIQIEESVACNLLAMCNDGSNLVRKELVIFFSAFVGRYESRFLVVAFEEMLVEKDAMTKAYDTRDLPATPPSDISDQEDDLVSEDTVYASIWKHLLIMSVDPDFEVSRDARTVIDVVLNALLQSPLGPHAQQVMTELLFASYAHQPVQDASAQPESRRPVSFPAGMPLLPQQSDKADGYFSLSIKRTASVAASLKNLAFGSTPLPTTPHDTPPRASTAKAARQDPYSAIPPPSTPLERAQSAHGDHSSLASYGAGKSPIPQYLKPRTAREQKALPLVSTFYDFSSEYFREPQMKRSEAEEPGSEEYNSKLWRRNRNERILEATQKLKEHAGSSNWTYQAGSIDNGVQATQMCFHQYDNHLAVASDTDIVRIWDWKRHKSLARFSNGNPAPSRVTGLRFINEDDRAIVMTGSADGVIRLFANYDSQDKIFMTSSFRALTNYEPSSRPSGLVFDWLQIRGLTVVAGDAKVIRVWSADTEICTYDIAARSRSCVTSLTSDQVEGNILVAGFGDGAVRVYDQRVKNPYSMVMQWREHSQWITNVHMQRGGKRELVSGSLDGEVKLWDIRNNKSVKTTRATTNTLRTLSVHEHAPVFATGSQRHNIKVFNMDGTSLSSFSPPAGFMNQHRSSAISATAFHPHRMILACSARDDNNINLYTCLDAKRTQAQS